MSSQITPLNRWKVTLVAFVLFLSRVSPQMVREGKFQVTLVLFVWSFRGFQMSPQTTCFSTCMVALVAFGRFVSRMSFKVYPQMTRIRRCVVTFVVAFVWFSPWMNYQMRPQTTCISGCKITLVAFVRFFSGVYFQMYPQFTCIDSCTVTLIAFVCFFLRNEFWSEPSNCLPVEMQSYIGCIDTIFLAGTGVATTLHPFIDVIILLLSCFIEAESSLV